jgi:myosin heavy subunit
MDPGEVKEIENECSQLDGIFKALLMMFEQTSEKQSNLSDEMERCKRVCDEHLDTAKHAGARYKTKLTEERCNLDALKQLESESEQLHAMTLQQIKLCSDQVEYSHQQTNIRIRTIDTEIQRLKGVQRQETDRLQCLAECKKQIDEVEKEEKTGGANPIPSALSHSHAHTLGSYPCAAGPHTN